MKNTAKSFFIFVTVIGTAVLFILKSDSAAEGVVSALKLCAFTVVPSLLPFMVLSSYLVNSDIISSASALFEPVCRKLFRLPGEAACVIIMSFTGGYPVGAKMIASAVESGILNDNQGRRMMMFCVNAGPAFVINFIGAALLGSKKAGAVLLAATIVSSLAMGFATRFFDEKSADITEAAAFARNKNRALVESVEGSVKTMVSVCGWITVFGAVRQIINDSSSPDGFRLWIDMLSEVTGGCRTAAGEFPLPVTAFVLGFSGFAVHAQLLPFTEKINLPYKLFLASRLLCGAISAIVADVLFRLFPCEVQVFSSSAQAVPVAYSVSAYAAFAAIFTALLIILDLAPARKM